MNEQTEQPDFWALLVSGTPRKKKGKRGYFHEPGQPHVGRKGLRGGSRKRPRSAPPPDTGSTESATPK